MTLDNIASQAIKGGWRYDNFEEPRNRLRATEKTHFEIAKIMAKSGDLFLDGEFWKCAFGNNAEKIAGDFIQAIVKGNKPLEFFENYDRI